MLFRKLCFYIDKRSAAHTVCQQDGRNRCRKLKRGDYSTDVYIMEVLVSCSIFLHALPFTLYKFLNHFLRNISKAPAMAAKPSSPSVSMASS